jgi:flagellar biosynthesis protein FlhF
MQLRRFTGRSANEAISLVRQAFGPDAVILSTETGPGDATTITAARDPGEDAWDSAPAAFLPDGTALDCGETVHEALTGHGTPARLAETLLAAGLAIDTADPVLALAGALESRFAFAPLGPALPQTPLILVGPPGAGKTLTTAKLAARAVLSRVRVRLISTDMVRAGAVEQLAAFARVLDVPLETAEGERPLARAVAAAHQRELVLVDTAGINPYNAQDRDELAGLIGTAEAEPLFVLPAGGDAFDTIDMALVFRELGCRRFVATRLDMVRRLGSLLAAADRAGLAFSEAGVTPSVAEGLIPLSPMGLAALLLPESEPESESANPRALGAASLLPTESILQ